MSNFLVFDVVTWRVAAKWISNRGHWASKCKVSLLLSDIPCSHHIPTTATYLPGWLPVLQLLQTSARRLCRTVPEAHSVTYILSAFFSLGNVSRNDNSCLFYLFYLLQTFKQQLTIHKPCSHCGANHNFGSWKCCFSCEYLHLVPQYPFETSTFDETK